MISNPENEFVPITSEELNKLSDKMIIVLNEFFLNNKSYKEIYHDYGFSHISCIYSIGELYKRFNIRPKTRKDFLNHWFKSIEYNEKRRALENQSP